MEEKYFLLKHFEMLKKKSKPPLTQEQQRHLQQVQMFKYLAQVRTRSNLDPIQYAYKNNPR